MTVGAEPSWVRCPACGVGLLLLENADPQTGMVTGTCGHQAYSGYLAELLYLQQRSAWLSDRVTDGAPAPAPEVALAYGVWDVRPPPAAAVPDAAHVAAAGPPALTAPFPAPSPRPAAPSGSGLQGVLLALGALLLVVSAVVFTAVAWPRLGALGQTAAVLTATVGSALAAVRLRRRLHGTAEALAVVSVGLALVSLAAAPGLGLLPSRWLDLDSGYWTIGLVLLAVLAVSAARRTGLRAWCWLGWLLVGLAVLVTAVTVVSALGETPSTLAAVFAGAAVLGCLLATGGWWLAEVDDDRQPLVLAGVIVVLVAGAVIGGLALAREALPAAAAATVVVGVSLLLIGGWLLRGQPGARGVVLLAGAVVLGAAAGMVLAIPVTSVGTAVVAAAAGVGVLLAGIRRERAAQAAAVAAALWAAWMALTASAGVVSALPTGPPEQAWAAFLVVVGTGLVLAGRMGDGWVRALPWAGVLLAYAGLVVALPEGFPDAVEAWTLPLAALLAVAGAVSGRDRNVSTELRWGPAVTVALVPSAVAAWSAPWVTGADEPVGLPLLRLVLVLVVGAAVLVVGVRLRWGGLVLPAAAAVTLAALAQVWTGLQGLPRWLALAVVGGVLVAAGARFEWVRAEGRRAGAWVRGLQ
jgi:hypothetical protein